MTLQQLLNKLLLPFRLQIHKAPKGTKIYGANWVEDVARLSGQKPPKMVFDIGANCGQTTKRLALAFPEASIRAFEPTPETFGKLQGRMERFPNVQCFNFAMGPEDKKAEFILRDHHETNSFFEMAAGSEKLYPSKEKITIDMVRMDSYVEKEGIEKIDIIKINAEGMDYQILRGAEKILKEKRARFIFAEVMFKPLFNGEATLGEIQYFMQSMGYGLVGLYECSYDEWGTAQHGNLLYSLRNP